MSRVCPLCGEVYSEHPALSRVDNQTLICPDCGIRQALEDAGCVDIDVQDQIIGIAKGGKA